MAVMVGGLHVLGFGALIALAQPRHHELGGAGALTVSWDARGGSCLYVIAAINAGILVVSYPINSAAA